MSPILKLPPIIAILAAIVWLIDISDGLLLLTLVAAVCTFVLFSSPFLLNESKQPHPHRLLQYPEETAARLEGNRAAE